MKKRILIIGNVHDVGYRPFLLGLAESLEIDRFFADNVYVGGKQSVEVLVDDEQEKVNLFISLVKAKFPENASVDEVKIADYDGNVMRTESYYRYLTAMQLAKIATYGGRMLEKQDLMLEKQDTMLGKMDMMLEKQDTMLGKMDLMLEKQDLMLEKQDSMLKKQDLMLEKQDTMLGKMDLMLEKQDMMLEKQDATISIIREESEKTRGEIRNVSSKLDRTNELLESRFEKLEEEIEKIKRALKRAGIEIS